ncbi:MAG: cyanophycin synthetase [Planctomycetota bacterium]
MAKKPSKQPPIVEPKLPASPDHARGPMTFAAANRYLASLTNLERVHAAHIDQDKIKLDRMRRLLDALDNPEASLRCVHVAGSKGKGSVCEMTAAAVAGCGYSVGLYTSPHLVDVRERIRVNGRLITKKDFSDRVADVAAAASTLDETAGPPTYFEALTAAALLAFRRAGVDLAVVEVGLGGRLDSTNLVHPDVTVVTELQLEHTQILGDTLGLIAAEKAGIFKPGVPAVTQEQDQEAMRVLAQTAADVGAPLRVLRAQAEGATTLDFTERFEADHEHGPHVRVSLITERVRFEHVPVPLPGTHQGRNAGLALAALDALAEQGFKLPEIGVVEGLAGTPRSGRLEVINEHPRIVVDGAHTPPSIASLVAAVGATMAHDSVAVVFGCAQDKDIDAALKQIGRGADKIIFTKARDNPRAADPKKLAERYRELTDKSADTAPTVKDAINAAARGVGNDDLILVTGSFYIAGEAKLLLAERQKHAARA